MSPAVVPRVLLSKLDRKSDNSIFCESTLHKQLSTSSTGKHTKCLPVLLIINVTITDKENKAVVEEATVNIKYDANRQEYELKITNLDTEYAKQ